MPGRIVSTLLQNTALRPMADHSLRVYFGRGPDSRVDADLFMYNFWAWDPWPARSGSVHDGTDQGNLPMSNRCVYIEDIRWSGVSSYTHRITGYVLDSLGQPVSGATCRLYAAIDNSFVAETVSESDGMYSFGAPDAATQYYVNVYRAAPPIAGGSVHTLVGAL